MIYLQQKPVEINDLFLTTLLLHIELNIYSSYKLFVLLIFQFLFSLSAQYNLNVIR